MQKRRSNSEKRSRKRTGTQRRRARGLVRWIRMFCIVMASVLSIGACTLTCGLPAPIQARLDIRPDQHARQGILHAEETREVDDGEFWVVINQLPAMEAGTRECNIQYENPASNHYSARISLYLEENGKLLGNTTRVDPGYYVESIPLKQKLAPGEYPVTVRIELFDYQTPAGEMSIGITLRVTKHQDNQPSKDRTAEYREADNRTENRTDNRTDNRTYNRTDSKTDNKTSSISDGKTDNKTDHKTETGREKQKGETG